MTNEEIGHRIKTEREKLGLTLQEVADMIGVHKSTIQRYEGGQITKIKLPVIDAIANALKVNPTWLIGKSNIVELTPVIKNTTPYTPSTMIPIPVIGRVAAGMTCLAEANIETYMLADATNLNRNYDYVWLRVTGDSMEPFILDGDYVLVQLQSMVNSGDVAVVIVNGDDGLVKKIEIESDSITLISSNPYYPKRVFKKAEMNEIKIYGKVIESKRIF